jgi:hypothetical protein
LKAASAGDPRSATKHLFAATRMRLEGLGLKKSGDESLLEYARRAEGRLPLRLSPWVQAYLQAVFDERFEAEQFARALEARRRFTASLRRCFSWPRRILGFLNPPAFVDREPR